MYTISQIHVLFTAYHYFDIVLLFKYHYFKITLLNIKYKKLQSIYLPLNQNVYLIEFTLHYV